MMKASQLICQSEPQSAHCVCMRGVAGHALVEHPTMWEEAREDGRLRRNRFVPSAVADVFVDDAAATHVHLYSGQCSQADG